MSDDSVLFSGLDALQRVCEDVDAPRDTARVVEALYVDLRPSVLAYVCHLLGPSHDAEDLVQVAFLKLHDHLRRRTEILNQRSWIFRVTHNLAMDDVSRRGRLAPLPELDVNEAPEPGPERALIERDRLHHALRALSDRERQCVLLRGEGLSYREIGDTLGISVKAVSTYLFRGLRKVTPHYEPD